MTINEFRAALVKLSVDLNCPATDFNNCEIVIELDGKTVLIDPPQIALAALGDKPAIVLKGKIG